MGFEPTVPDGITGFQDQLHKPLGHLSTYSKQRLTPGTFAILLYLKLKVNTFLPVGFIVLNHDAMDYENPCSGLDTA